MMPPTVRNLMVGVALAAVGFGGIAAISRNFEQHGEAARRFACRSNLRQIGLAIAEYLDRGGEFPRGTLPSDKWPLDRRLGWGFELVPSLTENSVNVAQYRDSSWDDPALRKSMLPGGVNCPSDPSRAKTFGECSHANYVGIAGLGPDAPGLPVGHPRAGVFGDDRVVTWADLKDGASTTLMVVEASSAPGPWYAGGRATVRGVEPARRPHIGPGRPFGGMHFAGNANVLMADGSVRLLRPDMDPKVFESMSTIAGHEPIPADPDD